MSVSCAIYTRKSSDEGLEQQFNSLDAQREACEAYILSQKAQGWKPVKDVYDDGGFSGGNLKRPALQRLLAELAQCRIKIVVVYKVDRLTRSLADFSKLVELFDAQGVSFVSVTQQFNTTSSMGRLTLNVLLSFAQFEREVTGERIRDKIAASKRKGLWMGGIAPMGYAPNGRTLAINEEPAQRIREIYALYLELGCVGRVKEELDRRNWLTPERTTRRANASGNRPFSRGHLYRILSNPVYSGRIPHRGQSYPGEHPAIVSPKLWEAVQAQLTANQQGTRTRVNAASPSLLAGLLFDDQGYRFTPTHAKKGVRRYRYYVSEAPKPMRLPAQELEQAVLTATVAFLRGEAKLLDMLNLAADRVPSVLCQAKILVDRLAAISAAASAADIELLLRVLERITIAKDELTIVVRPLALGVSAATLHFTVPARLARCGMVMRLIVEAPDVEAAREPDMKLVKLIAKGQAWFRRLASGMAASPEQIAREDGCGATYVTRVMYLAFLAPDIVDRIGRGEQPMSLNATRLIQMVPLPMAWPEQRALLGMPIG